MTETQKTVIVLLSGDIINIMENTQVPIVTT